MIIDYKDLKEIREKFADKKIVLIKGYLWLISRWTFIYITNC